MIYQAEARANETPGLEDYLSAVRRRTWLVIICALLGLVAAHLFTISTTDRFVASSRVLVNPTQVGSTDGRLVNPSLEREREVIASNAIANEVAADLRLGLTGRALLSDLEVEFVDRSDSLSLEYTSEDPEIAVAVVDAFATNYVEQRQQEADELDATTIANLEDIVAGIELQLAEAEEQIVITSRERGVANELGLDTSVLNDQITTLRTTTSNLIGERRGFAAELAAARLDANTRISPAEVLGFASVPTQPIGLSQNLLRAVGAILGLGLGVALAFVLQRLDRTARESGDVELALGSSVLGSLPPFGVRNFLSKGDVVMLTGGRSPRVQQARESFRRLRSSLQFLRSSRDAETYLITSAVPGEGKSTTCANLAVSLAQGGNSVCLVNADLRRPTIEKMLGVANGQGFSDYLNDESVSNIMVVVPTVTNLVVIPSGPPPDGPGELLANANLTALFGELRSQFDFVLIDAPPVLSTADAASISPHVDGTIIVVDSSRTDTDALLRVRSELERSGGTIVGAVLNKDNQDSGIRLRKDRYAYERVSAARAS